MNLILLSWSRIMSELFMETYLHKSIKILQFLSLGKMFNITSNYLAFSTINHPHAESCI